MMDLYFTRAGTEAELLEDIDTLKSLLAAAGILEQHTMQDGTRVVGNPRDVIGPRQGTAAVEYTDGDGDPHTKPALGQAGLWYLILRVPGWKFDVAMTALAASGVPQLIENGHIKWGEVSLYIPPDDSDEEVDQGPWRVILSEFKAVLAQYQ